MTKIQRRIFRIEVALGSVCGALFLLTLAWRDWIERVFGWGPDQHGGSLEVGVLVVSLAATLALAMHARTLWQQPADSREIPAGE